MSVYTFEEFPIFRGLTLLLCTVTIVTGSSSRRILEVISILVVR